MSYYAEIELSDGKTTFYPVSETADCLSARTTFDNDPTKDQDYVDQLPKLAADEEWYFDDCTGSGIGWAEVILQEYEGETGSGSVSGQTTIVAGNPTVLSPVVEWDEQGQGARILNGVIPTIPPGHFPFWFIDGQGAVSALPTGYVLQPGDEVSLFLAIATSPNIYEAAFNIKGSAHVFIGNRPTP